MWTAVASRRWWAWRNLWAVASRCWWAWRNFWAVADALSLIWAVAVWAGSLLWAYAIATIATLALSRLWAEAAAIATLAVRAFWALWRFRTWWAAAYRACRALWAYAWWAYHDSAFRTAWAAYKYAIVIISKCSSKHKIICNISWIL